MDDPLKKFFPFPEYRTYQKDTIIEIAKAFKSGKDNVILESPTGTGKSIIAMTLANIFNTAYFITAQKILQQQYLNDFPDLVDLKGRNAYPCWFMMEHLNAYKYHGCDRGQCAKRNKSFLNLCLKGNKCEYANQLNLAMHADQVLFNFSSFLFQREMAGRFLNEKKLLVIDEAHSAEQQIMNFVEVIISEDDIGEKLPKYDTIESYMTFFKDIGLTTKLSEKINALKDDLEHLIGQPLSESEDKTVKFAAGGTTVIDLNEVYFGDDEAGAEDQDLANDILKDMNGYKSSLRKYNYLKEYAQNVKCVCEYTEKTKSVCIKPLYANYHTPKLLLTGGANRLLMSATILNPKVYGESIGLDMSKTHYITVPHTFPKQNRLIYLDYAGPMDFKSRSKTMPKMINKVDKLMTKHANEKGIIHCQSFKLMKDISGGISAKNRGRLLDQKMFKNKDELLQAHSVSVNTVIIAPAMHEGLDLKNDLCYDAETEILTEFGWVKFPDLIDGVQVAAFDSNDGSINFEIPEEVIKTRSNSWVEFDTVHNNLMVTSKHRMLWRNSQTGNFKETLASESPASRHWQFVCSGILDSNGLELSDDQIRLAAAYQADGCWVSDGDTRVRFSFRRERKIIRLQKLLSKLNIAYDTIKTSRGDVKILVPKSYFVPLQILGDWSNDKLWNFENLIRLSRHQRETLLSELPHWDGTEKLLGKGSKVYTSSKPHNIDAIHAIASLTGHKASYNGHRLTWKDTQYSLFTPGEFNYIKHEYDTTLPCYCVTVSTGWVVVRRRGKVTISGNSRFQLICKVPYPDSRDNKQLRIRTDESWNYYLWLTALKLVQSSGRSVRSETDYASTYILDESFDKFFNMADRAGLLPGWFVESLVID